MDLTSEQWEALEVAAKEASFSVLEQVLCHGDSSLWLAVRRDEVLLQLWIFDSCLSLAL